jgi:hypothetical protein
MNCSIKTHLSKDIYVETKAIFRINKSVAWMTTVYDNTRRFLGDGQDRECLAWIDNADNVGSSHLSRCLEIQAKLEKFYNWVQK